MIKKTAGETYMKKTAVLLCLILIFLAGCSSSATENPEDYMLFRSKIGFEIHSNLTLFPDTRPQSAERERYYYAYDDTFLDKTVQIYYDCTYASEEDYLQETERLAQESNTYSGGGTAMYDNTNFAYPAYVIQVGHNNISEYALLIKDENRIIYVYVQYVTPALVHFDDSFLPNGYTGTGECDVDYAV